MDEKNSDEEKSGKVGFWLFRVVQIRNFLDLMKKLSRKKSEDLNKRLKEEERERERGRERTRTRERESVEKAER